MQGKIIKGIAGFYYVDVAGAGVYECKAKGVFRKDKVKPLVGDDVELEVLDEQEKTGNITAILPRRNALIRPAVANVDQAMVIFAMKNPRPNFSLLDRFLLMMERQKVETVICSEQQDLAEPEETEEIQKILRRLWLSGNCHQYEGRKRAGAGGSNLKRKDHRSGRPFRCGEILPDEWNPGRSTDGKPGEISRKLKRGKHTTRHSQLIRVGEDTFLCDTPGFTSLYVEEMDKEELRHYFREFVPYEGQCRFQGCVHIHEPGCAVKEALEEGRISRRRYENYKELYKELKEKEKRRYG